MKVNLTAERKPKAPDAGPYIRYVATAIGEALPALYRYASGERSTLDELALERLLGDVEHSARMARERIANL